MKTVCGVFLVQKNRLDDDKREAALLGYVNRVFERVIELGAAVGSHPVENAFASRSRRVVNA